MTVTKRLAAYLTCFTVGYGVPLVALATVQEGVSVDAMVMHSSSRVAARQIDASHDEMDALRARLWALTEYGDTGACNIDGIAAPCADVIVFDETD